jgi:hypothetical protein
MMRVFENRLLRRIFGPKREEIIGDWRKLHYEELNDLYSSNIIRMIKSKKRRWAGHVASMGERKGVHRVLVGKPEERVHFENPRCRWEDNIKKDVQEMGCEGMDGIELAQNKKRWEHLLMRK